MLYVFTGDGKGKTSAALGMAFRASGYGLTTEIIQFLKAKKTGEFNKAKADASINIHLFGKEEWTNFKSLTQEDFSIAADGFKKARELVKRKPFLLILDEFNWVVSKGLIDLGSAIDFLKDSCKNVHIVLTGREAPSEFIELADLVTEFKEVRHPFQQGEEAIKGLDY